MSQDPPSPKLRSMNDTPITLTLHLRLHAEEDHVAGEINDDTGRTLPFGGRIGLMCAIDRFLANHADVPAPPCPGATHPSEDT